MEARTRSRGRIWTAALAALVALLVVAALAPPVAAEETTATCLQTGAETLATDDESYAPGATAHITGTGYAPFCQADIRITRPDTVVESATVSTDGQGSLSSDYLLPDLPGIFGTYRADAIGLGGVVLASTTFTDGPEIRNPDVAPAYVSNGANRVFSTLVRNTSTDTVIRCIRIRVPTGYGTLTVLGTAFSGGSWNAAQVGNVSASDLGGTFTASASGRTIQITTTSGAAGNFLATSSGWARVDIQASSVGSTDSDWHFRAWSNNTCTSGSTSRTDVRVVTGTQPTDRRYTAEFVDDDGDPTTPSFAPGTSGTYRMRMTKASDGQSNKIEYFGVAVPRCYTGLAVTNAGENSSNGFDWAATVVDNFIRWKDASSGELDDGHSVTITFTADTASCATGTHSFWTVGWQDNDGSAGGDPSKLFTTAAHPVAEVAEANEAPVAADDSYATGEDTPLSVDTATGVLANDTDDDGDTLSAVLVTGPAHAASFTLNADGSFTYTPNADFNGTDSFTYKANDGTDDSNVATVTINVTAANDAPVANEDTYSTDEDTPLNVLAPGVLGNDSDVDGDTLTAVLDSGPTNAASFTLNADGSFSYTPAANFNGADSFTYHANDGTADSGVATVTITVHSVNDPPVANDDTYSTGEDTPLNVSAPGVLGNDTDVSGDGLTAVLVAGPANASSFTLNSNGSFSYTPNANFNGSDSFTYKANDGTDDSNVATVTINVTAANDAPTCADVSITTTEDGPGSTAPDCTDADGDALTYTVSPATFGVSGTTGGMLTYDPDGQFEYLDDGELAFDAFTYTASDGAAESEPANVGVTIEGVNDAPTAADDTYGTNEDTPLNVSAPGVLGNDTDADGDGLTSTLVAGPANAASFTFNSDGSFDYTPAADFNGTDSFTYKANDGTADSNVATVTITVDPVNDAPTCDDAAIVTDEDTAGEADPDCQDVDGDGLSYQIVDQPEHGSAAVVSGKLRYTPDPDFFGTDSFTYKANDGTADSNVADVDVTVNSVNDAPSVDAGDDVSGQEGSAIALDGTVSDVEGDSFTVAWTYAPASGVDAGATCSFADATAVDTTITCTDDGTYTATLTATDTHGDSGSDSTTVTVTNANPAVDISSPNDETAPVAVGTAVNVSATFTDAGTNDTHTAPAGGSCTINWGDGTTTTGTVVETPGSGSCSGSHTYPALGIYTITVTVTDDDGGSGSDTAQIVVFDPNGGFVTGGGWIYVQAGSYTPDPTLEGKGTFGFVSKYKNGASTPDGQTEFNFQVAGFRFHSETYKWLLVSGHKAQYTGTGRVNGESGYSFRLTAYDGQVTGGGGVDKFRLKITKNGQAIFDNRITVVSEDMDTADPQAIGGGSIVIHKNK